MPAYQLAVDDDAHQGVTEIVRGDDNSLARLRAAGTDPRQMVSSVARSAAIDVPPRIHAHELIARFDMALLPRSEVRVTLSDRKEFGLSQ